MPTVAFAWYVSFPVVCDPPPTVVIRLGRERRRGREDRAELGPIVLQPDGRGELVRFAQVVLDAAGVVEREEAARRAVRALLASSRAADRVLVA
jgi:hypothetical protein